MTTTYTHTRMESDGESEALKNKRERKKELGMNIMKNFDAFSANISEWYMLHMRDAHTYTFYAIHGSFFMAMQNSFLVHGVRHRPDNISNCAAPYECASLIPQPPLRHSSKPPSSSTSSSSLPLCVSLWKKRISRLHFCAYRFFFLHSVSSEYFFRTFMSRFHFNFQRVEIRERVLMSFIENSFVCELYGNDIKFLWRKKKFYGFLDLFNKKKLFNGFSV